MSETQLCVTWDQYLNHVSKGFSYLQQNAEFVDMTLAAEGHLVKVHQNIIALASPYLKAMIQSAPCRHPVVFLNNISYKILSYILEYIYTGEVKIPTNMIDMFIKACKSLCIRGIDSMVAPKIIRVREQETINRSDKSSDKEFSAHISINSTQAKYNSDNHYNSEPNDNNIVVDGGADKQMLAPPITHISDNIQPMDIEADVSKILNCETVSEHEIDVNNIKNFVIINSKNESDSNVDISKNKSIIPVKILSNVAVNTKDWETKLCSSNVNVSEIQNLANGNLNSNYLANSLTNNNTFSPFSLEQTNKSVNDTSKSISKNTDEELNKNVLKTPIQVLLNSKNWQATPDPNSNNGELETDSEVYPINITYNTQDWLLKTNENSSNIELNVMPKDNPVNITLNAGNWLSQSVQSSSNNEPNTTYKENPVINVQNIEDEYTEADMDQIVLSNKAVHKNIKEVNPDVSLFRNTVKSPAKSILSKSKKDNTPYYTVSNRGSLQVFFNNFLFNSHHTSDGGRKKRWRCIDYRKLHCPAFIDTDNESITNISENHVHPVHNKQIRKKIKSNVVFTSISIAEDNINMMKNNLQ